MAQWVRLHLQCRRHRRLGFNPSVGKIPWRKKCNQLQYSCLKNPWTEKPDGLQSMRSQRIGHNWVTKCAYHINEGIVLRIPGQREFQGRNFQIPQKDHLKCRVKINHWLSKLEVLFWWLLQKQHQLVWYKQEAYFSGKKNKGKGKK